MNLEQRVMLIEALIVTAGFVAIGFLLGLGMA
jgi:hypothetical protein